MTPAARFAGIGEAYLRVFSEFPTVTEPDRANPLSLTHAACSQFAMRNFDAGCQLAQAAIALDARCYLVHGMLAIAYALIDAWSEAAHHATLVDQHDYAYWRDTPAMHGYTYNLLVTGINYHSHSQLQTLCPNATLFSTAPEHVDALLAQAPRLMLKKAAQPPAFVLYFAADPRYLADYGVDLVHSAFDVMPDVNFVIHIHIYDINKAAMGIIKDLQQRFGSQIQSSFLPPSGQTGNPSYYACLRFVFLPAIMAHYGAPVVLLDADVLLNRSLVNFLDEHGADVVLCDCPGQPILDRHIAAAGVYRPTDGGLLFARYLGTFIWEAIAANNLPWYLDQLGLYFAQDSLIQRGLISKEAITTVMASLFCSVTHEATALIWATSAQIRGADDAFSQRAKALRQISH